MRADELNRLLARAEADLDPAGVEPRHDQARAERSLILQERDGMVHLTAKLDVETAAPIKTAIEAMVTQTLRRNEHADDAERDDRSVRQMQADALADLCRHAIGCTTVPTGPVTTVVVRMDLDDLLRRVDDAGAVGAGATDAAGVATIDGIDQPVPAAAIRRMAADAQVIPCVLGGDSDILDWGRTKRLFTPTQKLALIERDGGCVSCGAPPGWCIVHHIDWWERDTGPTDLTNGVLLCTACHHRIHDDGWNLRVDGTGTTATVWLTPPTWIDP
ncbi:DUF222 domain-containing protein, partial [Microbacterium sp. bgisy189]|uniref:HNH endonuclease n=1 Tax=Microbacterium sp. bgisy189 TaxID=3413798 RepID=UPI003EB9F42D